MLENDSDKKLGLLCRMGKSDLMAGTARGFTIATVIFGGIVGAVVLWWVNDLAHHLDKFDRNFTGIYQRLDIIDSKLTRFTDHQDSDETMLNKEEQVSANHEIRITCLEYRSPCRRGGAP